jgi:circadian clock protein KaiC
MDEAHQGQGFGGPPDDSSGIPNLDLILGGGIPRGSLIMVVGPPGSGKTTLATQMAFHAAATGRRVLILTALSEPTGKLVSHLRTYAFFDEALIGGALKIVSLEQFLPQGLSATADELLALTRQERVGLVVLDGFSGVRGLDPHPQTARQFLYHVGSTLSVRDITTVITSEANPDDPSLFPEATTADVIVGLHYALNGVRRQRAIEVIKLRGRPGLPGLHGIAMNIAGMIVYPRLETRIAALAPTHVTDLSPARQAESPARFEIPILDTLLGGGLERATTTLVVGGTATGKTLLGLRFALAGVLAGEPVTFLGFREAAEQLMRIADLSGAGDALRGAVRPDGLLTLLLWPAVELDPDALAEHLLDALARSGARRLVIDSMGELERAIRVSGDARRVDEFLTALVLALRDRGVTTWAIQETSRALTESAEYRMDTAAMVADNVLLLRRRGESGVLRRTLTVIKMRFAVHDTDAHDMQIEPLSDIQVRPRRTDAARDLVALQHVDPVAGEGDP